MIDWKQGSTRRGLVWAATAVIGIIGWWMGKDVTGLLLLAAGISGGLGISAKD